MIVLDRYNSADAVDLKHRAIVSTKTPAPFDVAFSDPERMAQRAGVVGTIETCRPSGLGAQVSPWVTIWNRLVPSRGGGITNDI